MRETSRMCTTSKEIKKVAMKNKTVKKKALTMHQTLMRKMRLISRRGATNKEYQKTKRSKLRQGHNN